MALTTRRTSTLPIPQAELDRLRSTLSPMYGNQVWEGAGARILVVRVPRPEPDLVQDIEAAVDYLNPGDVNDLTAALLIGEAKAHAVPTHPFKDLMVRRVQFDAEQCQELRKRLAPGAHLTYRAPGDPRKTIRLGLRLRRPTVAELGDDDLAQWGATLGSDLAAGKLGGVRAVYLVADQDDVRLDADLFLQDLKHRLAEVEERKRMAQQLASKQATGPTTATPANARGDGPQRVAYAPLRSHHDDAPAPAPAAHAGGPTVAHVNPLVAAVQQQLEACGFDVLANPPAQHRIDLAGERAEGDVQRVIVRLPEKLTVAVAQEVLATCRKVDTDLALIVSLDAEPEARKRLIATKVRWIQPDDLPNLHL